MRSILVFCLAIVPAWAQVQEFKPGFNLFSPQQDIEMGKEAADEVRKTMPVIDNSELTAYVQKVGARLMQSPKAKAFPFTFAVINDPSINAFALPGGPMFVNTGLLAAVDNETQLAGVLAHEMSHVTLRHGTNNVSKANLIQLPAMLGGAVLGNKGGIWGTLGQLGINLGAQSVLLRYSRDAEKQADLNGAQIMNDVGYNPTQMAVFFDKLQAEGERDNSKLANWMSDHPTPGRRVQYVEDQNKKLPKKQYTEIEAGTLPRVKTLVASLPAPPKPVAQQTAQAAQAGGGSAQSGAGQPGVANPQEVRPSGRFKTLDAPSFAVSYPDNWEVFGQPNTSTATVAPRAALVAGQNGDTQIGYGYIVSYYNPQDGKANLKRDTADLLKQITGNNPNMRQSGQQKSVTVAGQSGLLTPLESSSPMGNRMKEVDMVLTVARPEGLFYTVFIAPSSEWTNIQSTFDQIVKSLRFKK